MTLPPNRMFVALCGVWLLVPPGPSDAAEPKSAEEAITLGESLYMKGDFEVAISVFTEAIRLDPKNIRAYNNRGYCYRDKGDLDKAIVNHSEAIRLSPEDVSSIYSRACAYGFKGEWDKAISDDTEVIRLDPKDPAARGDVMAAYEHRAVCHECKGEKAKADEDFEQAKKLGYKEN